jgi:hypothetical protein
MVRVSGSFAIVWSLVFVWAAWHVLSGMRFGVTIEEGSEMYEYPHSPPIWLDCRTGIEDVQCLLLLRLFNELSGSRVDDSSEYTEDIR